MSRAALPTLTLYSRAGCHLCEQAEAHLRVLEFAFEVVDIATDPQLTARFGHDIPVLADGERVLLKGVLSRPRLSALKLHLIKTAAHPS